MTLANPFWLILLVPLAVLFLYRRMPVKVLFGLRISLLLLIVLTLCGVEFRRPSRAGVVVAVIDRSMSMPIDSEARAKETVDLLQGAMEKDQLLGVVSFGRTAVVDQVPQSGKFSGFSTQIARDASDLESAIETSLSLIPPENPGRILLVSDGRWTGKNPLPSAARAAGRQIPIDYRLASRSPANDLAVAEVEGPNTVHENEAFTLTAWVHAPTAGEVNYELNRGGKTIARGSRKMTTGLNRLVFRDRAEEAGTQSYIVKVTGPANDPVPENNRARLIIGVTGTKSLLLVSEDKSGGLAALLRQNGVKMKTTRSREFPWTLESFAGYSGILLENIPAEPIGTSGMATLAEWVRRTGSGLMMTGGKNAYAAGGYFKSPLEPIMPVSMELRQEHRKLSLGIVVAMDRSGSMAAPVDGGRTKMDLADLSAVQVLDLLSPIDSFGLLAVDSSSHTIVPLDSVEKNRSMRNDILRIDSMGGGIFIYEALSQAATMLLSCPAKTRHIILFADAADSEEPGKYQELLAHCAAEEITVSVIGLGTERDQDAGLLKDIARRGGGQIFFTDNPYDLPRLFAQDTFIVARSTFIDEPTEMKFTSGIRSLRSADFSSPPKLGGYNLCYVRPEANASAITQDEYKAPVIASWQAGIGRVLCYTGEADGKFTGPIGQWPAFGDMLLSMIRWTAGESSAEESDRLLTQRLAGNLCRVELHLDPDRNRMTDPAGNVRMTVLRQSPGKSVEADESTLDWRSADLLAAEVPIAGEETILATVHFDDGKNRSLSPMCLPYSPEYKPADADEGLPSLEKIARVTGGMERVKPADIWKDVPARTQMFDASPILLTAAMLIFLLEILERRTAIISSITMSSFVKRSSKAVEESQPSSKVDSAKTVKPAKPVKPVKTSSQSSPASPPSNKTKSAEPEPSRPSRSVWDEAKSRAQNRTQR